MTPKKSSDITLDKVLEQAFSLPWEQQEMLIHNIQHEHIEKRRAEIAQYAMQARKDFRKGKFPSESATELIDRLKKQSLEEEADV